MYVKHPTWLVSQRHITYPHTRSGLTNIVWSAERYPTLIHTIYNWCVRQLLNLLCSAIVTDDEYIRWILKGLHHAPSITPLDWKIIMPKKFQTSCGIYKGFYPCFEYFQTQQINNNFIDITETLTNDQHHLHDSADKQYYEYLST